MVWKFLETFQNFCRDNPKIPFPSYSYLGHRKGQIRISAFLEGQRSINVNCKAKIETSEEIFRRIDFWNISIFFGFPWSGYKVPSHLSVFGYQRRRHTLVPVDKLSMVRPKLKSPGNSRGRWIWCNKAGSYLEHPGLSLLSVDAMEKTYALGGGWRRRKEVDSNVSTSSAEEDIPLLLLPYAFDDSNRPKRPTAQMVL